MSQKGGCLCGNVRISIAAEPARIVLCHCYDCRKISGSLYSYNAMIKDDDFKVDSGDLKEFKKIGDSGNPISSYYCPDCGTTVFRVGTVKFLQGFKILKAGVMDDPEFLQKNTPVAELYSAQRLQWVPAVDGADQV